MKLAWRASLLLTLSFVWGACGGGSSNTESADLGPLVATVGGRPVSRSYYEDRLEKMEAKFLPDTLDLAGRREFLDFIINKELMAIKAEEMGLGEDEQILSNLQLIEDNLIHRTATNKVIEGKDTVTPEEIADFYAKKQQQRIVDHILVSSYKTSQEIHEKLVNGTDFDTLVATYSEIPRIDDDGLVLPHAQRARFGTVEYGKMQPWVEEAIWDLEEGAFTEPLQTAYGWHIFRLVATEDVRLTPLTDQEQLIEQQIGMRKRRKLITDYYENILKKHNFKLYRENLEFVYDKLPPDIDFTDAPNPETEVKPVIPFTIDERARALFEIDGKRYTVGDFSDRYDETSFFERPRRAFGSMGIYNWTRDGWLKHLQLEEARERGIQNLPEVVNEVKMRREQMMVGNLHSNLIGNQVPEPTEDEIREFYKEHSDVYVDKEKRVVNIIFHARERVVRRAYQQILDGDDFVETAIRYNDSAIDPEDVRTVGFTREDEQFAGIADVAFSLERGEMSEPFKTDNGWVLLQLYAVVPEKPFELEAIREFVVRDIKNQWSEDRLNELLEEWRQETEIVIYDDELMKAEVRRTDVFVPETVGSSTETSE